MDSTNYFKFLAAFVFVISLMALLAWVVKRMGLAGNAPLNMGKRRLSIVEYLPLDSRRRLMLIKRDDVEHLVILGTDQEIVVEANIKPSKNKPTPKKKEAKI